MEIVKCKDRYNGTEDRNYFNAACKSHKTVYVDAIDSKLYDRELEEVDLTDIIRKLK